MIKCFLGDVMGRKGFTLVELLATVVVLGLVMGIASYSVVGIINSSKQKSEMLFVEDISEAIDGYIGLNKKDLINDSNTYTFDKCVKDNCENVSAIEVFYKSINNYVKLSYLIDSGLVNDGRIINPVTKKDCLDGVNPNVRIFRDSDYVYYYYVDLSGGHTSCEISNENGIINTLPDRLKTEVGI